MSKREIDELVAKHKRWDAAIAESFKRPSERTTCPFCGGQSVLAAWSLFHHDPRTASLTIRCTQCAERMHAAVPLPDGVPDSFSR